MGLNKDFNGTAYYRFGDVIRKKNSDGNWDYWICVRPAFGKEGKQDTHWVTLSDLPEKNIQMYSASTGDKYYLPTKLSGGYSKIHWQNAAEMLFAILHPQMWRDNFDKSANKNMKVFNDFSRNKLNYHNQYYWQRVQKAWEKHELFNTLLHYDMSQLADNMKGIRFIYKGYSWTWTFSWNLTLWAQEFTGMDNNFHTINSLEKTENVKNKPFNVHEYGKYGEHSGGYEPFPKYTYPCRYSTGYNLAGFTPNEYTSMANTANGIEEVYVYNKEYNIEPGPQTDPEVCTKAMVDGGSDLGSLEYGFFTPGTIIRDGSGSRWLCYLSWVNMPEYGADAVGGGHKARFISFDNIVTEGNAIQNTNSSANYGVFATNLIPEKEVPRLAYLLFDYAFVENGPELELRELVKEHMGVNLADLFTRRDTLFNSGRSEGKAHIIATNFLYEPIGGHKSGSQPYMRYVMDGTHVGTNRVDLPKSQQYWMHRFFKKASDTADQRPLELTELYKAYKLMSDDKPFKADQWSRCKHSGTNYRDRDFTAADCYEGNWYNWSDFSYDTNNARWPMSVSDNGFTRPRNVSAYWEPVITVRYMEIEDTKQEFQSTYNAEDFTLLCEPTEPSKIIFRTTNWGKLSNSIGNTWMDYVPYNMVE